MADNFIPLISEDNLVRIGSNKYSFLSQQGFGGGPNDSDQDPGGFIGINLGNSGDTKKLTSNIAAINLAHDLDISWGRASGGPQQWNSFGSLSPENFDAVVDYANSKDVNIYLYLEYRTDIDGGSIFDFDWYEVGRTYAQHFGDRVKAYGIINEPDHIVSGNSPEQVAFAVEEFADGVHSVNPNYIVTSPGLGGTPISIERTNDFLEALAPLFNDNTLQVLNLHSYHDSNPNPHFSSIDNSSDWAPSRNFIRAKEVGGINQNVGFVAGEFNYRNWNGTDEERGIGFLTALWDQLSVVGNGGINDRVGLFSAPFTITGSAPEKQTSMADFYSFDDSGNYVWQPNEKGQVLEEVLTLTQGMSFIYTDPLDQGVVILRGNGRKMWVWDNREDFSSLTDAPIISISGIPSDATALAIYRWDSTADEPYAFIELNGQTSVSFEVSSFLPVGQTYMLMANSENDGGNIGSIDAAEIDGTENSGTENNSPIANDDTASTSVDTAVTIPIIDLLANDSDADGDDLTIETVSNEVNGTATIEASNVIFTPDAGFGGNASFEYIISDGNGRIDRAIVNIDVVGTIDDNSNPIANNDSVSISVDTAVTINGTNVNGTNRNDTLTGGDGDDIINGLNRHDLINGNDGNDTLSGGAHNDILNGGNGNDVLSGDRGVDQLRGGAGADAFVYSNLQDRGDTILDFQSEDKIDLSGILNSPAYSSVSPFDYIQLVPSGSDTLVKISRDGNLNKPRFHVLATLIDVNTDGLTLDNFLFE
ncbi:MAG: Ig-like domain-containing protein [Xenococcaceae cyanobacterium MO_234.B1]|nr:Ig-like domain-containing protein [Xenococcaceae cyanobacterium MO_234.B1]